MKHLKLIQKPILYLTLFFAISNFGLAQTKGIDNIVGKNYKIASKFLNEEREIQIYLPDSYKTSIKEYPVMYILDGQRFFLHTVSLHQSFVEFDITPEFIIVGINNMESKRNITFSADAKIFSDYLEKEVIPFVDNNFRTKQDRLLFGWAYGGGFVLQELISKPHVYTSYIAASPYPVFNKMEGLDSLIKQNKTKDKLFYYSSDTNEGVVKKGTDSLNLFFNTIKPNSIKWNYQGLQGEEHRSTPYTTLYHGIKKHFNNYPELSLQNLEEYKEKGGMNYVHDYYEKRAKDYGLSAEPSAFAKYDLIRKAIRANDYEQFASFMTIFNKQEFIGQLRLSWACTIAEYYKENQKYDNAIIVYEEIISNQSEATRPLLGIAEVYTLLKKSKKAKKYTQRAEVLSKSNAN